MLSLVVLQMFKLFFTKPCLFGGGEKILMREDDRRMMVSNPHLDFGFLE
jgi:hypothetical protein